MKAFFQNPSVAMTSFIKTLPRIKLLHKRLTNNPLRLQSTAVSFLSLIFIITTSGYPKNISSLPAGNHTALANTPPQPTANVSQTAAIGKAFSYTVNAFADSETPTSLTYSASISPANGLSFDAVTRVVSGKPSTAGVISVTVTAIDPGGLNATTRFSITVPCSTHPDYAALVDLYNATNGPNWTNKTNWLSSCNPCQWYGITCRAGERVSEINLANNNLSGSLPVSLSALSLSRLDLAKNQLSGTIPASLGKLTSLQTLYLNTNQLSGIIPAELGNIPYLEDLNLGDNRLTGSVPASLGSNTYMQYLQLNNNQLTGSIPASLGNIYNLISLNLSNNQLTGSIPASLGDMPYLSGLGLSHNQLSGRIPGNLGYSVDNYYGIDLSYNHLSGPIPDSLGTGKLKDYLRTLRLDHNQLTGSIPASLSNLTYLQELRINNNQLSGCFPASLSALCERTIDASNNPGLPGGGNFTAFCADGTGRCPTQPDATPILYTRPAILYPTNTLTVVVDVLELNNIPTSAPITLKITKDALINLSFPTSASSVGGRAVTNSSWTFSNSNPGYYVLTSKQPLSAGATLSVGLTGVFAGRATTGALTISAVVMRVTDESQVTNNIDSDRIEYFSQ